MRSPRARGAAAAGLLAVGMGVIACPTPSRAARGQNLTVTAALSGYYDDNLLEYSDAQLRDFEAGAHPDRFSLESRDDVVLQPSLGMAWEMDSGRGRRHALRLRGEGDIPERNGTADFRSVSAGWRESFRGERRLALSYYLVPHYYLRQLLDEDVVPAFPGLSRYRRYVRTNRVLVRFG